MTEDVTPPDGDARPEHRRRRRGASRPAGPPAPAAAIPPQAAPTDAVRAETARTNSPRENSPREKTPRERAASTRNVSPTGGSAQEGQPRKKAPRAKRGDGRQSEGALRELAGAGPSKLGVDGALRARDVNRPGAEDLAEAERDLVIVRRNWKPPADS